MNGIKFKNVGGAGSAEIMIYGLIGRDWWSNEGITAKDFADNLKLIPDSQEITVRINSEGGNVHDGLAIYNQLARRKATVTCVIDGVAASTAGWVAMAGKKVVMPKNALLMLHDPEACEEGDAEELRSMAAALDVHKASIVSIYVEKTGKTADEIGALMTAETWMTGEQALAEGFCDENTSQIQITNGGDFSRFKRTPESLRGTPAQPKNTMPNKPSGTAAPNIAGPSEPPAPNIQNQAPPAPSGVQATITNVVPLDRFEAMERQLAAERLGRITNAIDTAINEQRIPAAQRDRWIKRATADETVLNDLREMPQHLPGAAPLGSTEIVNESGQNLGAEFGRLNGAAKGVFFNKHKDRIIGAIITNANTIPAGLQRDAIAQITVTEFARRIAPLMAFSTLFRDTPLQGTDKLQIPYVPLISGASTSFVTNTGYVMADQTQSVKEVSINKRYYQPVRWTSAEFNRQPFLKIVEITQQCAGKLGYDVFVDVLSSVTNANYGAAASIGTASNFDSTDVATLRRVALQANWPEMGLALVIDPTFGEYLLRDSSIKTASSIGSDRPIREGAIGRIHGFDVFESNGIPANGENLAGFISTPSALAFGMSPITPTEEVQKQLTSYRVFTDPATGVSLEYRSWGNADLDQSRSVIECNYGYAVLMAAALKRITTA